MKGLILSLVVFAGVNASAIPYQEFDIDTLANDPASDFVLQTMNKGKEILELKSDAQRLAQSCALAKQRVGRVEIGAAWLKDFANLARESAAVKQFYNIVPNILLTKAVDAIGDRRTISGSYVVNPKSSSRGNNVYGVKVTVTDEKGKSYTGTAIVYNGPNGWKFIDAEYMGFSAVNYQAREYQKTLKQEYNKDPNRSMPVTALVRQITGEAGYVNCN